MKKRFDKEAQVKLNIAHNILRTLARNSSKDMLVLLDRRRFENVGRLKEITRKGSAVSHVLLALEQYNIVCCENDRNFRNYSINYDRVEKIMNIANRLTIGMQDEKEY